MYGRMKREIGPFPLLVLLLMATVALTLGCKKQPDAVETTPETPAVTPAEPPAEPVRDTNTLEPVREEPAPARSMSADAINEQGLLKTIYFDFDKYEIRPDQRATLRNNAQWLNGDGSGFRLVIEGHCDERGTNEYNMALGDRRANSTREYLVSLGVPANRIRTVSYGEERPSDGGHNETSWAKNRRSAFMVEEG
jgi:peptidoglycan-associated lipoprotein